MCHFTTKTILFLLFFPVLVFGQSRQAAPVLLQSDTLFEVYAGWDYVSADEKAEIIANRFQKILEIKGAIDSSTVYLKGNGEAVDLIIDDRILMTITQKDAKLAQKELVALAVSYRQAVKLKLSQNTGNPGSFNYFLAILGEIFLSLFCIAVFGGIFFLNNKLFNYLGGQALIYQEKRIKPITYQKVEFLSVAVQRKLIGSGFGILKIFSFVVISYLFATLFFEIFPATRSFSNQLIGFVTTPIIAFWSGLVNFLPHLIFVVVMILITHYLLRFLNFLSHNIADGDLPIPGFQPEWALVSFQLFRIIAYIFLFISILPEIPFGNSVYFQLAVALIAVFFIIIALPSLQNLFAGISLFYKPIFHEGDTIQINQVEGLVMRKSFLITQIKTDEDKIVSIPNSLLVKQIIIISPKTESK